MTRRDTCKEANGGRRKQGRKKGGESQRHCESVLANDATGEKDGRDRRIVSARSEGGKKSPAVIVGKDPGELRRKLTKKKSSSMVRSQAEWAER